MLPPSEAVSFKQWPFSSSIHLTFLRFLPSPFPLAFVHPDGQHIFLFLHFIFMFFYVWRAVVSWPLRLTPRPSTHFISPHFHFPFPSPSYFHNFIADFHISFSMFSSHFSLGIASCVTLSFLYLSTRSSCVCVFLFSIILVVSFPPFLTPSLLPSLPSGHFSLCFSSSQSSISLSFS